MASNASGGPAREADRMPARRTIRFPPALHAGVERAVEAGRVIGRSECIRAAIRQWDGLDTHGGGEHSPAVSRLDPSADSVRVCVRLPAALAAKVDLATERGPYPTASHAVRAAVRQWLGRAGFLEVSDGGA